ncbi:MAG: 50S ribosomal protein L25 [Candidatus Brocadiia bacterium]
MDIPTIEASPRGESGTRASRRLRRQGRVPVIMYGRDEPNVPLHVDVHDIESLLDRHALIWQIECDGESTPVQIREVQYDALGEDILHADLERISLSERVEVAVSVETEGEPVGVREEGGVLEVVTHEVDVRCLPTEIPESLTVEVSELEIGDDLRAGDIDYPEGVEPVEDANTVIVTCVPPMEMVTEEEEEALAEEFMAEPEVIGAEEEEEEEEEEELLPEEEEELEEE